MTRWSIAILLGAAALGSIPPLLGAAAPASPAPAGACAVRSDSGDLIAWGDLTAARIGLELAAGRRVEAGIPDEDARHAYYLARGGACPECAPPPRWEVEVDEATGEARGWRCGPASTERRAGVRVEVREPTTADQAQAEAWGRRQRAEALRAELRP